MAYQAADASELFRAVSDATRRGILALLRGQTLSVGEIATSFPVSRPAISQHLRVLLGAGLVVQHREGRQRLYELRPQRLRELDRWLEDYRGSWQRSLDSLKGFVESEESAAAPPRGRRGSGARVASPRPRGGRRGRR